MAGAWRHNHPHRPGDAYAGPRAGALAANAAAARREGEIKPRQSEQALHRACAEYLDLVLVPPTWWTTFPAGGGGRVRGAILRGTGLKPGVPDILIVHKGVARWVELKAQRGRLSADQTACHARLAAAQSSVAVVRSLDELRDCLRRWQIPTREFDPAADAAESYYDAIAEIGRRVKGGAPVPTTGYFGHRQSEP